MVLLVNCPCVVAPPRAGSTSTVGPAIAAGVLRRPCYRHWCFEKGPSVSSPTVWKIADFLLFLRVEKRLSVLTIRG